MLKANSQSTFTFISSTALWFPGTKMEKFAPTPSSRALEIAKRRDELLGLLNNLPESDYELSLTDLVENGLDADKSKDKSSDNEEPKQIATTSVMKERRKKISSSRSSCGSSSDGVLLNFYMPTSLSRSLPASRSRATMDCNIRRDIGEPATLGCWSALWERSRRKSRRSQAMGSRKR